MGVGTIRLLGDFIRSVTGDRRRCASLGAASSSLRRERGRGLLEASVLRVGTERVGEGAGEIKSAFELLPLAF